MVEGANVHNEVNGDVFGSVVQAGVIHQVVLPPQPAEDRLPAPRQLPPAVRDFVGREDELALLGSLLPPQEGGDRPDAAEILLLEGAAGVGKTVLAVKWAHETQQHFPDGTLFADLRGYGPDSPIAPSPVLASFLQALGVPEGRIPAGLDTQAGLYRSLLADRRILVLLDNAATAGQIRPLLPGSAGCRVLVTSRAALTGLLVTDAARRVVLDTFTLPEAAALVRRIVGDRRAGAEPDAVTDLIASCAGLPLALRVAATRVSVRPHLHVADVVAAITASRYQLDALRTADDSHSTVSTVFGWSYDRLRTEHARTFRRIGLHVSTELSSHATAALTGLDVTTANAHLETLSDLHLIEPVGRDRYRIHDLLHAYAAQRADRDDDTEARRGALVSLLSWYARTVTAADRLMFPSQPLLTVELGPPGGSAPVRGREEALLWLTSEQNAILTALRRSNEHGLHRLAIAIAAGMRFLALRPRSSWQVRLETNTQGLTAARACGDRAAEGSFLEQRADTYQMLERWAESNADLRRLLDLAVEIGDTTLRGDALCGLGHNHKLQHRYAEALAFYKKALPIMRATRNGYLEAVVECNLSQIKARQGHYRQALEHAERESALRQVADDAVGQAYALHDIAVARQGLGDHHAAVDAAERAVGTYRSEVASERYLAAALETLAVSLEHTGHRARAVRCLREAEILLTELGDPRAEAVRRQLPASEPPPHRGSGA